ncbi:MAG: TolC family protein [Terriglobia bacterium]
MNRFRCWLGLLGLLAVTAATLDAQRVQEAQQDQQAQGASSQEPAGNTSGFSYESGTSLLKAYTYPQVPSESLSNSPQLYELIRDGKLELSLEDALALALQNNLDIAVGRFQVPLAQLDVLRAKSGGAARGVQGAVISNALFTGAIGTGISGFTGSSSATAGAFSGSGTAINTGFIGCCDPFAGFSYGWNNAQSPLNFSGLVGQNVEGSHTATYSTFYGQGFLSGTSYSVTVSGQRQSTTAFSTSLFDPSVGTGLAIGLDQHLLKGFGYRANAVFIRIARNDLKVADSVFRQQVMASVAQVLNAYYTLLADKDQVRVAEAAIKYAQQLVDDDKKEVEVGLLAPLDVVQAQSQLANSQQNLIVAQTTYLQQQEVLKTMLSKNVDSQLAAVQIDSTDQLPEPRSDDVPALEEALKEAVQNRPEIEQNQLNLRNQEYTIQANRNGMLPTLDAFATYAPSGLTGIPTPQNRLIVIPGGFGDALGDVFSNTHPNYSVGFTFSVPLRNRAQEANAAQAMVERHMMETSLQRQKNQVGQDVRNAEIAVTQAKAQIAAAVQARIYAQQALDAEVKKFKAGTSTTLNVILEQQNLVTAEGNEAKARATYASSLVQFQQATATILDAHHIVLGDAKTGHYTRVPNIPGAPSANQ